MPDIVVMFFLLGVVAGLARSDLKIPKAAYDTLSLLLMLTIGLKGGMALHGHLRWSMLPELLMVTILGIIIPLAVYPILRRLVRLPQADSASIAAHYGSVSAGTFAVTIAYAESLNMSIGPEVTLYLALLELPAIVTGILIFRRVNADRSGSTEGMWHEALTSRGVILLAGGVAIGLLYGPLQGAAVTDLFTHAFKAVLALFLLEMGLTVSETLRPIPWHRWKVLLFALVMPTILAMPGLLTGLLLGLPDGSTLVLAALTASASYIAAPAAIRNAIADADIGLAMMASLGVTFPFNVIVGIHLYHQILTTL